MSKIKINIPKITKGAKKENELDGNTGRPTQCYRWCFTLHKYTETDITHLKMRLNDKCKMWIFGEEVGKKEETPHLQGAISLKKKMRLTGLKKWDLRIHWSRMRNEECAYEYCKKEMRQRRSEEHLARLKLLRALTQHLLFLVNDRDNPQFNKNFRYYFKLGRGQRCIYDNAIPMKYMIVFFAISNSQAGGIAPAVRFICPCWTMG